jgi:FkbM family methyltransferase
MAGELGPPEEPFFALLRHALPNFAPAVVFDVGANVGQSSAAFAQAFPAAAIYAFEPAALTYSVMIERLADTDRVRPFNLALGRRAGRSFIEHGRSSASHRLVGFRRLLSRAKVEPVLVTTGDRFCRDHGVAEIGFLKVDTEGSDLDVLRGFRGMLSAERVGLVEAEVAMNRANRRHVPLASVQRLLEPLGYSLFHLHEQVLDLGFSGRPVLRRCNAVFVSRALAEANRRKPNKKRIRA